MLALKALMALTLALAVEVGDKVPRRKVASQSNSLVDPVTVD